MQAAPATSQKTPKVANDDFLSADEISVGWQSISKIAGNSAARQNAILSATCRAPLDTRPIVIN
jgi:hypothetical protein